MKRQVKNMIRCWWLNRAKWQPISSCCITSSCAPFLPQSLRPDGKVINYLANMFASWGLTRSLHSINRNISRSMTACYVKHHTIVSKHCKTANRSRGFVLPWERTKQRIFIRNFLKWHMWQFWHAVRVIPSLRKSDAVPRDRSS